jgi:hypothetical protein
MFPMVDAETGTLDVRCSSAISFVAQQQPSAKRKRDMLEGRANKSACHSSSKRSTRGAGALRAA